MPDAARKYREAVRYLQHQVSAELAVTGAADGLKTAYGHIAGGKPGAAIPMLEKARAAVDLALWEARQMTSMDDAAVTGKPAA